MSPTRSRFCCVSSIFFSACFFRLLNLVMPAASSMRRRRSSGLALTMRPILPCSTIEYALVPAPVPRKRSVTSRRRTWRLVDEVVAVAGAVEPARDGDLGVVLVLEGHVVRRVVLEGERDLGEVVRRARLAAAEDDVFHRAAAEVPRALLAHAPADGVDDVRLAAAVRADDAQDVVVEVEDGAVDERLEADELELLDLHPGAPRAVRGRGE